MKLTVTGIQKFAEFCCVTLVGETPKCHLRTQLYTYVAWADRDKYPLESEHEMELWAVMEEPADQSEDTPERQYRAGGGLL